ncbi:MAG: hypothetical protein ACJ8M1_09685 [Chthoniobacterales bacterium]|jgi:hypothetical protein
MIYQLSLQAAGLAVGIFLLVIGAFGLISSKFVQSAARQLPRSRIAGIVLLTVALIWTIWLLATIEMGEFSSFRRPLLVALPIGYVLVIRFVDEFLAVRALGILCLLAAEPLIDAAFLRYELSRLVVTVFAYLLVVAGLFWVTMPYLLRDQINWATGSNARWRLINGAALLYGAVTLTLAMVRF